MAAPTGKFRMNEGDWVCVDSQCGNVNFARRTSCNRCGKEKAEVPKKKKLGTEIGKAAADKSGGLFSADDWQCSKCGNVNWARRQSCNMCNAPKFGEVEERTGYGGGFNERENVEYVERDDSDGEYDEFGRKKKKFRGHSGSSPGDEASTETKPKEEVAKQVKPASKDKDEAEEEDEDDDDDEDGDLSKYDLSGWGEEGDDADVKNNEKDGGGSKPLSSSSSSSNSASGGGKKKSRSRSKSPSSASKGSHSSKESRSPAGGGGGGGGSSSSSRKRRTSRSRSRSSSDDSKSKHRHRHPGSSRSGSDSKSRDRSRSRSGS